MIFYTEAEVQKKLAVILEKAFQDGEVRIKRSDGVVFVIRPEFISEPKTEVHGDELEMSSSEIKKILGEGESTTRSNDFLNRDFEAYQKYLEALDDGEEVSLKDLRDISDRKKII